MYFSVSLSLSFYLSLTRVQNTKKKGGDMISPCTCHPVTKGFNLGLHLLYLFYHLLLSFPITKGIFRAKSLLLYYFIHKYISMHLKKIITFLNIIRMSLFLPLKRRWYSQTSSNIHCLSFSYCMKHVCFFYKRLGWLGCGSK